MLTQCPSCQTTFRVTSEILRVAHGQVRCGRCQTQFDALERLIEEADDGSFESGRYLRPPRYAPPPPPPPGEIEVEEPLEHEDITMEGRHIEITGTYEALDESGRGQPQIRQETEEQWVEDWVEVEEESTEGTSDESAASEAELIGDDVDTDDVDPEAVESDDDSALVDSAELDSDDVEVGVPDSAAFETDDEGVGVQNSDGDVDVPDSQVADGDVEADSDVDVQDPDEVVDPDLIEADGAEHDLIASADTYADVEPQVLDPDIIEAQRAYAAQREEDEDLQAAAAALAAQRTAQARVANRPAPAPARPSSNRPALERAQGEWTAPISARRARAAAATAPAAADDMDLLASKRRLATPLVWKVLVAPLVLLMLVQVVHNYRATLARHPQLGPPLLAVYNALGLTLRPDWDLHAYEIRQWGVTAEPAAPGTLKVRASVKNLAEFAQPYPLLRLVLEDRWGQEVRAREFEPAEYLDPTAAPDRFLAPAQQSTATIAIVDPGPDAEGFRFDVCLRGARGPVCAADLPRK